MFIQKKTFAIFTLQPPSPWAECATVCYGVAPWQLFIFVAVFPSFFCVDFLLPFLCICFLLAARAESAPQAGSAQQSGERATATSTATRRLWKDRSSDSSNPTTPLPLLPLPYGHLKQPPSRSCCWRCRRVLGCRKTSLALALTAATAAARQQQWQQRRQWQLSKPTFHPLFWFFSGYSGGCLRAF